MQIKPALLGGAVVLAVLWHAAAAAQNAPAVPETPAAPAIPAAPAAAPAPAAQAPSNASTAAEKSSETATPSAPPEEAKDTAEQERTRMKDLLFDAKKKQEWAALSPEREKVLKDILPTMTFNGLSGAKLDDATPKVNDCTGEELSDSAFENYDVATAITKCLFKLGYAP